jgi:hypothetical protein
MPIVNPRYPRKRLEHGVIRKCKDIVVKHLMIPGTSLERYVKTWQIAVGRDIDNIQPEDWNIGMFPVFKLELQSGSSGWFNEVTQKTHIDYTLMLGTEGTDEGDGTDFFEAVVDRLYPGDMSLFHRIKPLGVMSYTITGVGVSRYRYPDDEQGQVTYARLTFLHELRTKY